MTAQVALFNGLGIALASDSAVTAGAKVLNSSEKIFDLHLPHKVAILTAGRADFMGIPWEVVLSAWSQTLDQPLRSLTEYREDLYKYIRTILPDSGSLADQELSYMRSSYFGPRGVVATVKRMLDDVLVPFYQAILDSETLSMFMSNDPWEENFSAAMSSQLSNEVIDQIKVEFQRLASERRAEYEGAVGVKESLARVWIDKYWVEVERKPSDDFSSYPAIPGLDELVNDLWSTFIVHCDYEGETGLHILGYGAGDLFPSGAGVWMHGVINGTLIKRFEGEAASVLTPRWFFFGQYDAIRNITSGQDSLLIDTAVRTSRQQLSDIYERISSLEVDELESTVEYIKNSLETGGNLEEEMRKAGEESREIPFKRAIEMAPIRDLAEFAAQLVGVQAASAAMTQENPTVGGPVDVAIITHRGGFQWIRHSK